MPRPDQPLRVAYLVYRGNPHCGGQGVYTRELARELTALGHTVEVFSGQPYPDLVDSGQLTRVGQFKSYVFFFETVTKGQADKGGRCPDGTISVARQGDNLALSWFGSVRDDLIVASGTLSKR